MITELPKSRPCLCDVCTQQRLQQRMSAAYHTEQLLARWKREDDLAEHMADMQEVLENYSRQDFDDGFEQGYDQGREEAFKQMDHMYEDHRDCYSECPKCNVDLMTYDDNVCNH